MMRTASVAAVLAVLAGFNADAAEPWTAVARHAAAQPDPRILVIYDMEGLSGQDDVDSFVPANPAYAGGQRLLTDDVNAVIQGLFAGGAGAVSVADGHGGSAQIDILTEQLDPRARMVMRVPGGEDAAAHDAIAIVGMHAGSGSGGFAAHTWTAGVEFRINGRAVNEAELIGLTYGESDVPVIFVSGDDRLGEELKTMPWIEYVTVKKATGITTAELLPLAEARTKLTLGAKRAIERLRRAKVMKVAKPVEATVTAFPPADMQWLADMPGIDYRDQAVSFTARDAQSAYRGMQALGTAAMYGYSDALFRALKPHENAKEIELGAIAEWDAKWEASERERAQARSKDARLATKLPGAANSIATDRADEDGYPGVIRISVDASDTIRGIFRVRQSVPVARPGPMTLLYPKWHPGYHAPSGPIHKLAGLIASANGKPLSWTRDPLDVYAFQIDVPAGAAALDLEFQYLSPTSPEQGRIVMTPDLLSLQWHTVVLYPADHAVHRIKVEPSVTLPAGWKFGTALEVASTGSNTIRFEPVSLHQLADSPLFAGRHSRQVDLDPAGPKPVRLNLFADDPSQLEMTPGQLQAHRALVRQADLLFRARPYDHYDFLLSLSERVGEYWLEHHQSSENSAPADYFTAWDQAIGIRSIMAHEYVHAWNGNSHRPADSLTPSFHEPVSNELLWVYEGQAEYWGYVLAARSDMRTAQQTLDALATIAAASDHRVGRGWRPLADTMHDPIIGRNIPLAWPNWQRSGDYYPEGVLLWLDVDTKIRELSGGKRSLDDFARRFFGDKEGYSDPVSYELDDVVKSLHEVAPHDWAAVLEARLNSRADAPLDGLARGGYRLVYTETPSEFGKTLEAAHKSTDLSFSLGVTLDSEGRLTDVLWDSPAFAAGLTIGTRITAVNGIAYDADTLKQAITEAKTTHRPISLLVRNDGRYRTVQIDYRGGLRYPRLERIAGTPDRLGAILQPRE